MKVCLLSLSLPYFREDCGHFLFCLPLARSRQQIIEGTDVGLEELVGLLQALPFYQAGSAEVSVRCWEAGLLTEGTTVKESSCIQCGSYSFHDLFLLMKLIWIALATCKDVIEGKCLITGLRMDFLSYLCCHIVILLTWALFSL